MNNLNVIKVHLSVGYFRLIPLSLLITISGLLDNNEEFLYQVILL